ncbi:MAG: ATP-binding protein [Xenococcaceae cyanobacterium MO_188.B19]|nr:ATP-binding protein [Xenococcaceae cyanobacterium MO_188.B19]
MPKVTSVNSSLSQSASTQFKLVKYFSLSSFFAFLITTIFLGIFYRQYSLEYLIQLGENNNAILAKSFSHSVWLQYEQFLRNTKHLNTEELRTHPKNIELYQILSEQIEGLSVLKIKIYDLEGRTVFSTEREQIGEDKSNSNGFLAAKSGSILTQLDHRDTFNAIIGSVKNRELLSSYVPIISKDKTQQVQGVFELYTDVTPLIQEIQTSQKNIILGTTVFLSILYLLLMAIVKKADKLIVRQNLALNESQKSQQAAEIANNAKSEFLANMSHELRTPLNAVLGFTQLMSRDKSLTPQQQDYLDIISRSGEHLLSLINDVLNLSKIESGQMKLNPKNFNLYRLLKTIKEMFKLKVESKGLKLILEHSPDLPEHIKTDEQKLRQVLINLLSNGIKFTQAGTITLRFLSSIEDEKNIKIYCEVEDTGKGIPEAELEAIFKPFVQTSSNKQFQEGTGLGLAISKKFVQLMGGDMIVSSIVNQGTIMKFDFIVETGTVEVEETSFSNQKIVGLQADQPNYRILIVDDRWENRQMLLQLLKSVGFEVSEAKNGQEAIDVWSTWQPHLIWMDMRMPIMDGYQATQEIRSHIKGQSTVIIALTASAFDEQQSVALSAGCNDFIHKPFREGIIWEKMAEYLGVSYVYETTESSTVSSTSIESSDFRLNSETLQVMSQDWIASLEKAALDLDEELITELIGQIPDEYALLSKALADKLNNFDFGKILELTQKS